MAAPAQGRPFLIGVVLDLAVEGSADGLNGSGDLELNGQALVYSGCFRSDIYV